MWLRVKEKVLPPSAQELFHSMEVWCVLVGDVMDLESQREFLQ